MAQSAEEAYYLPWSHGEQSNGWRVNSFGNSFSISNVEQGTPNLQVLNGSMVTKELCFYPSVLFFTIEAWRAILSQNL